MVLRVPARMPVYPAERTRVRNLRDLVVISFLVRIRVPRVEGDGIT